MSSEIKIDTGLLDRWMNSVSMDQSFRLDFYKCLSQVDATKVNQILALAMRDPNKPMVVREILIFANAWGADVSNVCATMNISLGAPDIIPTDGLIDVVGRLPRVIPMSGPVSTASDIPTPNPTPVSVNTSAPSPTRARTGWRAKLPNIDFRGAFANIKARVMGGRGGRRGAPASAPDGSVPASPQTARRVRGGIAMPTMNKKVMIGIGAGVLILALAIGAYFMSPSLRYSLARGGGASSPSGQTSAGGGDASIPVEEMPVLDNPNPLDFKGSVETKGFLGLLQKLILVEALGIIASLIGDVVYRKQWKDGTATVLMALMTIAILIPAPTPWWVSTLFLLLEFAIVFYVSDQGGKDYSPMAAYFLLIGTWGGIVFRKIGAIQSIFPNMIIPQVLPIVQLGVKFQLMAWGELAFPLLVYFIIFLGVAITIYESCRPSDDGSARWGSLASAGAGLLLYFVFLYAVHLTPWICYLIAFLAAAGGSAAVRSAPARQVIAPIWGVRSPFDGAMLVTAVLLLLQIIFGVAGIPGMPFM